MIKIGSIKTDQRPSDTTCSIDIDENKKTICTVVIKSKNQALVNSIESAVKRCVNKLNPKK